MTTNEPTEGELGPDAQGLRREDTQVEGADPEPETATEETETGEEAGETETTEAGEEPAENPEG